MRKALCLLCACVACARGADVIINEVLGPVRFSLAHRFLTQPTSLVLTTATAGASIRYTLDGTEPTASNGVVYTQPILINQTRIVRAAAFKTEALPSKVVTQTYLYNLPAAQRALPVLSLVTATNNLYGPTGIMGISGGTYGADGTWRRVKTNDYYNPSKKGLAWERPVSVELIRPNDTNSFTVDCGIRIHASDYFRPRMHIADKFSFTLYFRGDYGASRLEYPWFTNCVVEEFNEIVLRAGSNDPINPFLRDELVRRLASDTGQAASHGAFVNLFINGSYVKYYNPVERIDKAFCQAWHGGGDQWDIREQSGQMVEGTRTEFESLLTFFNTRSFNVQTNYLEAARRLDLTNFVDYLLPLLYADTGDWPHNNWRAARERTAAGMWRFHAWDAEWSFGLYNKAPSHNPFTDQMAGTTEIPTIFKKLKVHPEFRMLFADRAHQHLFNGGALTDDHVRLRYEENKAVLKPSISGFNDTIGSTWIPQRRGYFTNYLATAGLFASANAPRFSHEGGLVPTGYRLTMATDTANPAIYYTTDGSDPRLPFTGSVAPAALPYRSGTALTLNKSTMVRARTLQGTNWSALTEAIFEVGEDGLPVRFSEIMYHPAGGDAYEFIELQNVGGIPVNLSGVTLVGVKFRFPGATPRLMPSQRMVLISDADPAAFAKRYPGVAIAGTFGGSLANDGEQLGLVDTRGHTIASVSYADTLPWPQGADGKGYSLEMLNPNADANNPVNWRASLNVGGSPGVAGVSPVVGQSAGTDLSLKIARLPNQVGVVLRFGVLAGRPYRVQFRDELELGSWQLLREMPSQAVTAVVEVPDSTPVRASRFYRLVDGSRAESTP